MELFDLEEELFSYDNFDKYLNTSICIYENGKIKKLYNEKI